MVRWLMLFLVPISLFAIEKTKPYLRLETFVEGGDPLYVGGQARFGYRYYFTYSIELSREEVPLLAAEGFRKIGEAVITARESDGLNVVEASQVVVALSPGTFSFGPSVIVGKPYNVDRLGRKVFADAIQSEAPVVIVTVVPVPFEGRPTSFNGAIGDFTFDVKLISPPEIRLGARLKMVVTVKGTGDFASVKLPDFSCQPGMAGMFTLGDIPSVFRTIDGGLEADLEISPQVLKVSEIPSLAFSFWNPEKKSFVTLTSEPIPIRIIKEESGEEQLREKAPDVVQPISNVLVEPATMRSSFFGTFYALYLFLILPALLALQMFVKKMVEKRKHRALTSEELFSLVEKKKERKEVIAMLLARLEERGNILDRNMNWEELSDVGEAGKVRRLIFRMEKGEFGRGPQVDFSEIAALYKELL